jgi:hypothetical protein
VRRSHLLPGNASENRQIWRDHSSGSGFRMIAGESMAELPILKVFSVAASAQDEESER